MTLCLFPSEDILSVSFPCNFGFGFRVISSIIGIAVAVNKCARSTPRRTVGHSDDSGGLGLHRNPDLHVIHKHMSTYYARDRFTFQKRVEGNIRPN